MSLDDVAVNESKEPYESFLYYLLQNGDEDMKSKLKEKLTKKQNIIKKDYINNINTNEVEKIFVESDIVYLSDFNLNIGCPINIEIAAGDEEQKLIEIKYSNSVLYIGFNLPYYDINFHLIKYCPNVNNDLMSNKEKGEEIVQYEEHKFFYEIFKLEKTQGAKIIIFIKNPGIYKVLFDNKYSWFKAKLLRYRCTILKEMNTLNLNSNFSDEIINNEKKDESDENKNENNEKNEDKKEGEDEENKKSVKIAVKFGNTTNIPNIDLGEAEEDINDNDIDVELK
jgi:hypothetical protein